VVVELVDQLLEVLEQQDVQTLAVVAVVVLGQVVEV
jgi:hypothetical protein